MWKMFIAVLIAGLALCAGAWFFLQAPPVQSQASTEATSTVVTQAATSTDFIRDQPMTAILHTNKGDITVQLFATVAPNTVANFIKLANQGFYDGTKFHRVIKGFMDQGGDPLTKDDTQAARWGTGGPGYTIQDEFQGTVTNTAGTIAMANTGQPNSAGSQFFINAVDNHFLDGKYTVFGKVTAGMDVVTAINNVPTDAQDRPLSPVILKSVTLTQ